MANAITRLKAAVENADNAPPSKLSSGPGRMQAIPARNWQPASAGGSAGPLAKALLQMPNAGSIGSDLTQANMSQAPLQYAAKGGTIAFATGTAAAAAVAAAGTAASDGALGIAVALLIAIISGLLAFLAAAAAIMAYPGVRADARAARIDASLPMALRHLSTQIKAGMPLDKSMTSVASSGYGELSVEFTHAVSDMRNGVPADRAINDMAARTRSKGLRKAGSQIVRSVRSGGRLAEVISQIASEASFEQTMRLRDFTEQLNIISVAFIMAAVVAPVVMTVLFAVTSVPMLSSPAGGGLMALAFAASTISTIAVTLVIKRLQPPTE